MASNLLRRSTLLLLPLVAWACGGGANSRYQGMDADALFRLATTEYEEGDHDNAIEALDRLLISFGNWARVAEARLMLGDAYFAKEEYLTARSEYQRFLDRHAGHPRSPDAALGMCRSLARLAPVPQRDQSYTQEAIAVCRNVVIDYSGLPQATEAAEISNELRKVLAEKEFNNGEYYFKRKLYDSAIIYWGFAANLYPETEWAPRALLGIYRANSEIGYDDLAEEAREQLLSRYPESEAAAEVRGNGSGH
jgi:outer membrane protein assembly factor BamD